MHNKKGFTLIEMLIAFVLLGIFVQVLGSLMYQMNKEIKLANKKINALNIAILNANNSCSTLCQGLDNGLHNGK